MSPLVHDQNDELTLVYLGLGGNVGDVLANMAAALRSLDADKETTVLSVSKVYKTPPWGIEDQDWFLNCCAKIETNHSAQNLLETCLNIEADLKRKRTVRWGPRSIDIDILAFGDLQIDSESLTVPHPRMQERAFVMLPLMDIAPDLVIHGKSAAHWMRSLNNAEISEVETPKFWWKMGN